ncbi:serine/threonine-protein kinase [Nocardia barduliensis]|uniref:serine/threonine-protein kinase n=1 Tax=Nocardia barduliensis TaxID=2736643 RepID=UPI0015741585|nr:serine/threonine-protein kinase [Nocardia barduliensis]
MTLRPGQVFAGYRIERTLGSGGMGTVYLARHPRLPRSVALKVLDPVAGADSEFRARFQREAELAARLDHPNVVEIYDRGSDDGRLWMSMRYVAGSDVAQLIQRRSRELPPGRAIEILAQAAQGLDAAHRRGLLHRDVKPANLLVATGDDGRDHVFVTDFGIARSRDDTTGLTAAGALIATLGYVAPEQIRGEPLDHRCDVYALGATFYQMLTGAMPFAHTTPAAVLRAHLAEPPPRPSAADPALPAALDAVVATAMAKRPEDRYATCGALAAAAAAAFAPPPAPPGPRFVAPSPSARTSPRVLVTAAAVSVLVLALAGVLLFRSSTVPGAGIPDTATSSATSTAIATSSSAGTTTVAAAAWGRNAELVALFPGLLPATPEGSGYQGARCTDINVVNNGGAPAVECRQDNGIHWYVWSFRRGDPRRDSTFDTNIDNDTTRRDTWRRPSGSGRVRWSHYPGGNTGLLTAGFDDPARAWVVIDVSWDHHTGQDLFDQWWQTAPL